MSNPFQDQLLKAGLVTKKQVQKARQDKNRKKKQQASKNERTVDQDTLKAQQAAQQKAERDRELNRKKQQQAQQKAISIEINQLITSNCLVRDDNCEIAYNFQHDKKIRRIYVDEEMKQKIAQGKLGIARIEGRYELVPLAIAEKIQQRNEKRIIIVSQTQSEKQDIPQSDDPYSEYQVPDDLMW